MISTFYIYVDGCDLDEIGSTLRIRIESFVEPYGGRVRVVDQRGEMDAESSDLPAWDLGVNFDRASLTDAEAKDLLLFFQSLSNEFGRDFVVGGASPQRLPEDFVFVSAALPLEPAIRLLSSHGSSG